MSTSAQLEPCIETGPDVPTVDAHAPVQTALESMTGSGAPCVLVLRQGRVVGILSRAEAESCRLERPAGAASVAGPPKMAWLR